MIKEYWKFIKDYLKVAQLRGLYIFIIFFSAFLYKAFAVALPFIGSLIIKYLTEGNTELTYFALVGFLLTYLLYNLTLYINYKVYGYNMNYSFVNLTNKIMKKLVKVDSNFTRMISKGSFMNSINADLTAIGDMNDELSELVMTVIQVFGVIVVVCFYNVNLGLIMAIYALSYILARNHFDRKSAVGLYKSRIEEDKYSTLLTQIISGLQEVKTFNILPRLEEKFEVIRKRFDKAYITKRNDMMRRDCDARALIYAFRFCLYVLLIFLMTQGRIDISGLVLVIAYHRSLTDYIHDLIDATSKIREVNISVQRVNRILNYNEKEIPFGLLDTDDITGAVEFRNVSLEVGKEKLLKNINLKIDHNEVVAIVGETGSGKTMLLNLLLRLYKPTRGKVLLDGTNIYEFSKKVYANNVSVANQKPFIFNMSIRKNLDFVDTSVVRQVEACRKAGIHDFIETLPDGYNTILRENGSNISGGQKQMISIARTILSNAEVLLLDDITTSLDPDTAKLVPRLLKTLKKDHTLIVVTKKPELMREADRIVVMNDGRINDVGTHKQLLARNEIYQMLQARRSPSKGAEVQNV